VSADSCGLSVDTRLRCDDVSTPHSCRLLLLLLIDVVMTSPMSRPERVFVAVVAVAVWTGDVPVSGKDSPLVAPAVKMNRRPR